MKEIFEILKNYMKDWKKEQTKTILKEIGAKTASTKETVDDIIKKISVMSNGLPKQQKTQLKLFLSGIDNLTYVQRQESEAKLVDMGEMRSYEKN